VLKLGHMYPEHPTPPPGSPYGPPQGLPPVDYLNQIAPKTTKPSLLRPSPKLFAIIGGILVIIVIILSITVNTIVDARRQPLEQLASRLAATETIVTEAQGNLKSSQLRSLNSSLKLYLTNVNRDIGDVLGKAGVDTAKIDQSVVAQESTTALAERLEDARLNAVYDRTYAREMAYKLATTLSLLQDIYAGNYSDEVKTFAEATYTNLQSTQEELDSYEGN
jgi:hypothetical protein